MYLYNSIYKLLKNIKNKYKNINFKDFKKILKKKKKIKCVFNYIVS